MASEETIRRQEYSQFLKKIFRSSTQEIAELTNNLLEDYVNRSQEMNVYLTNLILQSCGIRSLLPDQVARERDFDEIETFLEKAAAKDKLYVEYYSGDRQNICKFFARIIISNRDDQFSSYFVKLLSILRESEIPSLRMFSTVTKLNIVEENLNDDTIMWQQTTAFNKFVINIFDTCICDVDRHIWERCLQTLYLWFFRYGTIFLTDDYFRFVIWSLRDRSTNVILLALHISTDLVTNDESRPRLNLFVTQLLKSLSAVAKTSYLKIFKAVCDCSQALHEYFEPVLLREFERELLENVYAVERDRAKIAGELFMHIRCEGVAIRDLQSVVNFLRGRSTLYVDLFVDTLLDDYPLLTNWNVLAEATIDEDFEETKDCETLLLLILCVIRQLLTDDYAPPFRGKIQRPKHTRQMAESITESFESVVMKVILRQKEDVCQFLMLKITTYFDFDLIANKLNLGLLGTCLDTLTKKDVTISRSKILIDLIINIKLRCSKAEVRSECDRALNIIKCLLESQFETIIQILLGQDVDENECQMAVENIMNVLYTIFLAVPIDRKFGFEWPKYILTRAEVFEKQEWAQCRENCVVFASRYAVDLLDRFLSAKSLKYEQPGLADVQTLWALFADLINDKYDGRFGQLVFHAMCTMIKKIWRMGIKDELLFSNEQMRIATYVAVVASKNDKLPRLKVSSSETKIIIEEFLKLVELNIFSLHVSFELLYECCTNEVTFDKLNKPLTNFFANVCKQKHPKDVATTLLRFLKIIVKNPEETIELVETCRVAEYLTYLLPKTEETNKMAYFLHIYGIDYALNDDRGASKWYFFAILREFSRCLTKASRSSVYEYLRRQKAANVPDVRDYVTSLRNLKGITKTTKKPDKLIKQQGVCPFSKDHSKVEDELLSDKDDDIGDLMVE